MVANYYRVENRVLGGLTPAVEDLLAMGLASATDIFSLSES